jgi:hypothetical protein
LICLVFWACKTFRLHDSRRLWSVRFILDLYHLPLRWLTFCHAIKHYLKRVLIIFLSRLICKVLVFRTNCKSAWLLFSSLKWWMNGFFESLILHCSQVLLYSQNCGFPDHILVGWRFETHGLTKTSWIRTFESPQVRVFVGVRSCSVFYLFKCFESLCVLRGETCLLL